MACFLDQRLASGHTSREPPCFFRVNARRCQTLQVAIGQAWERRDGCAGLSLLQTLRIGSAFRSSGTARGTGIPLCLRVLHTRQQPAEFPQSITAAWQWQGWLGCGSTGCQEEQYSQEQLCLRLAFRPFGSPQVCTCKQEQSELRKVVNPEVRLRKTLTSRLLSTFEEKQVPFEMSLGQYFVIFHSF